MADHALPHFKNDLGVPMIEIGAKEFMCMGASSPFDHPHIYIDMGSDDEAICSYCTTLYRYRAGLGALGSNPAGAAFTDSFEAA